MKWVVRGAAVMLVSAFVMSCSSGATVKQVGASNKKSYHTRNIPNARSGYK